MIVMFYDDHWNAVRFPFLLLMLFMHRNPLDLQLNNIVVIAVSTNGKMDACLLTFVYPVHSNSSAGRACMTFLFARQKFYSVVP